MSDVDLKHRHVGDVVADDHRAAEVFRHFGVDYCCGGSRTVEEACLQDGADVEQVAIAIRELERHAAAKPANGPGTWTLDKLARHIVETHHAYVRDALPFLTESAARVLQVHGSQHAELGEVERLIQALSAEMREHMEAEESGVFPRVIGLVAVSRVAPAAENGEVASGAEGEAATSAVAEPGSIRAAIEELEGDHDRAGEIVRSLRGITGNFSAPPDACTTYRLLYSKLEEFEADLHEHVHLENNILFPRALALEQSLGASAGAR